jgi:single-strand DNA-binding protein
MAIENSVTLIGNLTRDPEMRFTPSGVGQAILGLAVSRRYQDKGGEWQEESGFYNVVCWRDLADNVQCLSKGTRVIVTGRLQWRQYQPEGADKKTTIIEILADEIGPSLRWARVDVHRNERKGPGDGGGYGGGGGNRNSGGGSAGGGSAPAGGGYDDFGEEPF